jgi:FixJ family two-component response regulator
MPRMSGLDLQTRLSEMSWRVPIIFASAYSDVDIQSKALDNGAIAFLYKPFFAEALLAAVDLALSQYITGAP